MNGIIKWLIIIGMILLQGCGNEKGDRIAPVITLNGFNPMNIVQGTVFSDPGATAIDNVDGEVSVSTSGTVDVTILGSYSLSYTATDSSGNSATEIRTVNVVDSLESTMTFPSEYYPTKAHPRLWLTQERIDSLTFEKNTNTERWQAFQNMCDSIIDTDTSNDPYGLDHSPQRFTAPLALMYRLTNDTRYADKALELMDRINMDFSQYSDPDHENYDYLGLAYDWLYNYAKMTDTKKSAYRQKMKDLSDVFYNQFNLTASGTDSDQNLLTGNLHLTFGAAMYGEANRDAIEMLDRAWYGWVEGYSYTHQGVSTKDILKAALGGIYFTGMAYFPSTDILGIAGYTQTFKTACDYDLNVFEPELKSFWSNILQGIIVSTDPTRTHIENYGSWQDANSLETQPWMRRAVTIANYFAVQAGDVSIASLGKGYNEAVELGEYNDPFLELFFNLPNLTSVSPYQTGNSLPLIYTAQSPDFMFFRDNWTQNAIWGSFRGDGSIPFDHQSPDHGHFSLWYQEGYLTKGARTYDALAHGDFFNTLSIQNSCRVNDTLCSGTALFDSQKGATLSRHREGNQSLQFAYSMLEADGQWNDESVQNVKSYRRHFFWTPKYVVLLDRVRTNVPLDIRYRLRAMVEPSINGDIISQTTENGNYKLLHQTIEPSGVTLHKVNEKVLWQDIEDWVIDNAERNWQSYIDFADTQTLNLLNVMQMGVSSRVDFDTLENLSDNSNIGLRIGDWMVLHNREEQLRSTVEYRLNDPSSTIHHLVTDMESGEYQVLLDGVEIDRCHVETQDNTALFSTQGITTEQSVIKLQKQ